MFENAYFGKPYKTRDGRKALYISESASGGYIYVERSGLSCHNKDGSHRQYADLDGESPKAYTELDIVSEWHEEIDEEKIGTLFPSSHEVQDHLEEKGLLDENYAFIGLIEEAVQIGWEWGYRKAKEL